MKCKLVAILLAVAMMTSLTACGAGEETTLSGMVASFDGTVISLMEIDMESMGDVDFSEMERPEMPEGMEDFPFEMENFPGGGEFNPENFKGEMPQGENFPQWEDGKMPEGMDGFPAEMPKPENGEMPEFSGENGGMMPGFGNFDADVETTDVDIADAHISVEIEGGKASGSMEDIQPGTFVTVTMNRKGKVSNVLVSSQSFFGGGQRPVN